MDAAKSIKLGYLSKAGKSTTKTISIPSLTVDNDGFKDFANAYSKFLANPVTEAAKIVTTPISLAS